MKQTKVLLTLWLTIAATGVWAEKSPATVADNISAGEQVQMSDGRTVKAMQVPRRASDEDYTYTYKGVKYTYISENNYTNFFNTSVHTPQTYGWYPDDDGWFINAEGAYVTAASIDEESVPENGEVYILNDLVGYFTSHTHLGCVADQGFTGESKVKRIYFQDANAQAYNANSEFHFFIGHMAFANAPYLEKVDLMQYTTKGTNHWEAMPEYRVKSIWDNAFEGSPNAMIRVATSVLNDYRNSSVWANHMNRIISYEPSGYEIKEYGARYKCMLAQDGKTYLTNDGEQREEVKNQLRLWNADYQSFNATSLMAPADNGATVYYTTIEGADAEYLKSHDGVLRVYNDVGSYYNYKNIAIRRDAFANCEDLKTVEFWQTNGRSENSYSDLKVVIENGAFRGCKNLKEIRLYYYVQNGTDHWVTLGPQDVIPGDNIFGWPTKEDLSVPDANLPATPHVIPDDVHIVVSPSRYNEFLSDPNWSRYAVNIVAADYEPTSWSAEKVDGLVYDYASKTVGMASTNHVVTQELSWLNVPIKAIEIYMLYTTIKSLATSIKGRYLKNQFRKLNQAKDLVEANKYIYEFEVTNNFKPLMKMADDLAKDPNVVNQILATAPNETLQRSLTFEKLYEWGCIDAASGAAVWTEQAQQIFLSDPKKISWLVDAIRISRRDFLEQPMKMFLQYRNEYLEISKNILDAQLGATGAAAALGLITGGETTAALMSLGRDMDEESFQRGLSENFRANLDAICYENTMVYIPDKKLVYHVYVDKPEDPNLSDVTIYNDIGRVYNYRTVAIKRDAFRGNQKLRSVKFAESYALAADAYTPMLLTIPDSAFAGCTALEQFNLIFKTRLGGERGLGPENFILGGTDIFAGCDSTKLQIIIPRDRLNDFLDSESWSRYKRFFVCRDVKDRTEYTDFGVDYAFAYNQNTTQKVSQIRGHKIEHLAAVGADSDWLGEHKGSIGLFNDIGIFNNYKLDYVKANAFRGNQQLRNVSCWDIKGWLWGGDTYYNFGIVLQDSCFADCPNLEAFELIYLCTDGINEIKELQPSQIQLGSGVFDNTPKLMLKMTLQQQRWFEADTAWAKYKDKFTPCLVKIADSKLRNRFGRLTYSTDVGQPTWWTEMVDLSKLKGQSFDYLNDKFANLEIIQFPEFKQFEWAGLDYIGGSWFVNDYNLTAIELPSTIKKIGGYAFQNCDLREIELPAAVTLIDEMAFNGNANLKVIRCLGDTPAALGIAPFEKPEGLKIYVPAEAVNAYKEKWSDYKDYIVAYQGQRSFPKVVTTTEVGQLAEKLGLETIMSGDFLTGLKGAYWNIDSLTVSGPLNGVDVGVLRFLGGADVNNSDPTYGRLRYLNLYNARLKKDEDHPYQCHGVNDFIGNDDVVDEYMFYHCNMLETVILPKEATYIGEHVFDNATNLRRLCVGNKTRGYDDQITKGVMELEELVFLSDVQIESNSWEYYSYDSWGVPIRAVFVPQSQIAKFMGEPALTQYTNYITSVFEDNQALRLFAENGYFFPSEIFNLTSIDGILTSSVETFDELQNFNNMTTMERTFAGCRYLRRTSLPDSLKYIGRYAFDECYRLDSIFASSENIPELAEDAFASLPAHFRIFVPKTLAQRYREAWPQYANHIEADAGLTDAGDIIEVTNPAPNMLAEVLGLDMTWNQVHLYDGNDESSVYDGWMVTGITGNYSHIKKLKVNGPISGGDLAVIRFLAGVLPWNNLKNLTGQLEYVDLYDADLVESNWRADYGKGGGTFINEANVLPSYALANTQFLKTVILPRTCTKIWNYALEDSKALEVVVIGDDTEEIDGEAFNYNLSLTRLYLLSKKKPKISTVLPVDLYDYHPTLDAFYVRPSLLNDYLSDTDYTGNNHQRTNSISTGIFKDDEHFMPFARHAAATADDIVGVRSIKGWFDKYPNVKDLTPLRYTLLDTLKAADMKPLTKLERIAIPMTLASIEDGAFADAKNLRWADFLLCDSTVLMTDLQNGGLRKKGLTENTLCYLPASYGQTDEVNVVLGDTTSVMNCANYRLVDGMDYDVPYKFNAKKVENTRTLAKSAAPYTVCLPYDMQIPNGAKAYKLSGRSSNELIFTETTETLQALQPYLIWTTSGDASLNAGAVEIPASGGMTYGKQQNAPGFSMRGTLYGISNAEAADLGAYTLQQDGKWHPVMSDTDEHRAARILPFRAYLLQNRVAGARAIGMTLEDVTGIEQLRTIDSNGTERIYDLNGRQLSAPTTGINIINGKKVIKR